MSVTLYECAVMDSHHLHRFLIGGILMHDMMILICILCACVKAVCLQIPYMHLMHQRRVTGVTGLQLHVSLTVDLLVFTGYFVPYTAHFYYAHWGGGLVGSTCQLRKHDVKMNPYL